MTVKAGLSRANPNALATYLQQADIGQILRGQITQVLRKQDPAAFGGNLATLEVIQLPNDARGSVIHRATVRAGTVTGELTPVAYGVTPATTQIAVGPNGHIVVLAADAITDLDVVYTPERGDVVTLTLPVATNVLTIPAAYTTKGIVLLLDIVADTGTATGRKIVLVPGAGAPAAGQARLNIAKTTVTFAAADAVTKATATLSFQSDKDLHTVLESAEKSV